VDDSLTRLLRYFLLKREESNTAISSLAQRWHQGDEIGRRNKMPIVDNLQCNVS
jgi:hypothetical protein